MRLFTKLFLLLVAIATVPLALAATALLRQSSAFSHQLIARNAEAGAQTSTASEGALMRQAEQTLVQVVREKAGQLEGFFENLRRAVLLESTLVAQHLAHAPPDDAPPTYGAADVAGWVAQPDHPFTRARHARDPYITWHAAPDADAATVRATVERLRPLGHFFAHNQRALPWCTSTYLGHPSGVIVGYPGRSSYKADYDPRKRPWYRQAVEARHLVWTDLYLDRNGKDLVITCANPILAADGTLLAVAAIDVTLTQIVEQLFTLRGLPVTDAILVDMDGRIRVAAAYATDTATIESQSTVEPPDVRTFLDGRFAASFAQMAAHRDRRADVWLASTTPGGPPDALFAWAATRIATGAEGGAGDLAWVYVMKIPLDAVVGPVREIRRTLDITHRDLEQEIGASVTRLWTQVGIILAAVAGVALFVAWRAAHRTSQPLVAMAAAAEAIGRGDLTQHVAVQTTDEVGAMAAAINHMVAGLRERDFVKQTFKRYVAASVVDQLLADPEKLKLGGERRDLTVFFSDLAGFSGISERMSPEALVALINEYLGAMTDAILAAVGTLDKYHGDAIMAFWGAPLAQDDHALRACRAALDNVARLATLWPDWERRGLPRLDLRIGINTGPMVVGNMGSPLKTDYTVMGDAVNTGSRLEGANKAYGTRIMISETTRRAAGDAIVVRELDRLAVVGRAQPVTVFELLGLAGQVPAERLAGYRAFESGLAAYRARAWDDAEAAFRRADAALGEDRPSRIFLERVTALRAAPPPPDWDGTFTLTTK